MAAEAQAIPVADLRQDAPADLQPATGAQLATRLAEACADCGLKNHFSRPEVLGRDPTPDEAAIHAMAVEACDAALQALVKWPPASWEEFADKSEAIERAFEAGCVRPDEGLTDLLADLRRLALTQDVGVVETAIPMWVRERERRRRHPPRMTAADGDPCSELFVEANALILRAPCGSFQSVLAKMKALTDRQIELQHGPGDHDLPCLEQIIAFLDQELCGGVGLSSRLAPDLIEALRLGEQASTMGLSETPDEVWLGDPLYDRAGDLMDGIHLAPCTSRADAAIKLGALQADLDEVENWDTVRATVSASVGSLRSWLLDAPSKIATDDIITRREFRQLLADEGARMADDVRQRGPSLTEAALEVGMHHLQLAAAEHRAHRPDLGATDMAAPELGSAPMSPPTARLAIDQLRQALVEAWEDLRRKAHLSDDRELGRERTADEDAIYCAASAAVDAAVSAVTTWRPESWRELARKSKALEHPAASDAPEMRLGSLQAIQEDIRRLDAGSAQDPAEIDFRRWERERERNRPPLPASATDEEDLAKLHRMTDANDHILRTPCRSIATAAIKLRAVLDPENDLFSCGDSLLDEPALRQVLAFLEGEPQEELPESPLYRALGEAIAIGQQAEDYLLASDQESPEQESTEEEQLLWTRQDDLLDAVHLASCTCGTEARAKLDAVIFEMYCTECDLSSNSAAIMATMELVRAWIAGEDAPSLEGVLTRRQALEAKRRGPEPRDKGVDGPLADRAPAGIAQVGRDGQSLATSP